MLSVLSACLYLWLMICPLTSSWWACSSLRAPTHSCTWEWSWSTTVSGTQKLTSAWKSPSCASICMDASFLEQELSGTHAYVNTIISWLGFAQLLSWFKVSSLLDKWSAFLKRDSKRSAWERNKESRLDGSSHSTLKNSRNLELTPRKPRKWTFHCEHIIWYQILQEFILNIITLILTFC